MIFYFFYLRVIKSLKIVICYSQSDTSFFSVNYTLETTVIFGLDQGWVLGKGWGGVHGVSYLGDGLYLVDVVKLWIISKRILPWAIILLKCVGVEGSSESTILLTLFVKSTLAEAHLLFGKSTYYRLFDEDANWLLILCVVYYLWK